MTSTMQERSKEGASPTFTNNSLLSALDALCATSADRVLMRHKQAGIWQCFTRGAFRDLTRRQAGALAARGIGAGASVAVIGENRPEIYAAIIAAQALGADAMPLGAEFLRRFGMPEGAATLALAADEASARWWAGDVSMLSSLAGEAMVGLPAVAAGKILLHDDGRDAPPKIVAHTLRTLQSAATTFAPGIGEGARLVAFLPISSVEDAALSLALPVLTGVQANCVEGPSTFPLDLREVTPDVLAGPARMWELIDRDIRQRLGRGRDPVLEAGKPGASTIFTAPLRNAVGLSRCRVAVVTSGATAPDALARLRALGLPLQNGRQPDTEAVSEALLRETPVVDRARVWRDAEGLRAEIATEPAEAARLIDENGTQALTSALEGAAQAAGLTRWMLRAGGFAPGELTLSGDTRHCAAAQPQVPAAAIRPPRTATDDTVLMEAQGVSVSFGGVKALTEVSMQVRKGEILSIIGPNGAGKTSFLNTLNGVYVPREGRIVFEGKTRARMRPAEAAASGIGRTFQHVSLFPGLNVIDNIVAGQAAKVSSSPGAFLARALRLPSVVREESNQRAAAEAILDFLDLTPIRYRDASTLPYGVQKRVELGRALAGEPRILLLDEPMAGMTHEEKQDMCRFIRAANIELGTTIVLIEHDIGVVMGLSDRVVVLNYGRKIADGTPAEVRADPEVIRAYLGTGAEAETART